MKVTYLQTLVPKVHGKCPKGGFIGLCLFCSLGHMTDPHHTKSFSLNPFMSNMGHVLL